MALRALIKSGSLLLLLLMTVPAGACFGPKLYLGVSADATGQVLSSFVAIYIKETTGTEVVRVPLDGLDPVEQIRQEKIDISFVAGPLSGLTRLMTLEGLPTLISGPRIDQDLQFTTVRPTLVKLATKLTAADVVALTSKVNAGAMPMDVVRHFLIDRSWI